jgi:transcriptional antiterminator Rof (Rho-off)
MKIETVCSGYDMLEIICGMFWKLTAALQSAKAILEMRKGVL